MRQSGEVRWLAAYNSGSYEVPPFGLVQIAGAEHANVPDRMYLNVQRPASDDCTPIAINSWKPIPPGDYGLVTLDTPVFVLYDTAETPVLSETWGPKADTFYATYGYHGLEIIGAEDSSREIVLVDSSYGKKKLLVRFTADTAFTQSDETVEGTITLQIGPGSDHASNDITAYNMVRSNADYPYEFFGDSGDTGYAYWDKEDIFYIIAFECP